jgi:hypothetical protein
MTDIWERSKSCSSPHCNKIENNGIKQADTNVNNCDLLAEVTGDDFHSD